ncbi:MAG: hypothetical protein O7G84_01015 [Gammaproteobacteria bacterium]|nr:hypothetical protein [Gammaproteobacteria bacterium]
MSDPMMDNLRRLQFPAKVKEIFDIATSRGWRVKLVIWKPDGEEWELNPSGSRQISEARRPADRVQATQR